jgi:hypothetical protein
MSNNGSFNNHYTLNNLANPVSEEWRRTRTLLRHNEYMQQGAFLRMLRQIGGGTRGVAGLQTATFQELLALMVPLTAVLSCDYFLWTWSIVRTGNMHRAWVCFCLRPLDKTSVCYFGLHWRLSQALSLGTRRVHGNTNRS